MFAGCAPPIALAWLAIAYGRRKLPVAAWVAVVTVGVWCSACLVTLYLGSSKGSPISLWWLFWEIPGLDALRSVTRVTLLQMLPAGLAVGIAVTALMRSGHRWGVVLGGLLAVLPLVENWSRCPANVSRDQILSRAREVADAVPRSCEVFFWRGLPGDTALVVHLDAMFASMELGKPTVNGYSGHEPPEWHFLEPREATLPRLEEWLDREGRPGTPICLLP
jgi:hypothetical protein